MVRFLYQISYKLPGEENERSLLMQAGSKEELVGVLNGITVDDCKRATVVEHTSPVLPTIDLVQEELDLVWKKLENEKDEAKRQALLIVQQSLMWVLDTQNASNPSEIAESVPA